MKRNKGITLIALVITIIVLLILAGVAISMLSGENGTLKKAAEAKTKTEETQDIENKILASTELQMYFSTNNKKRYASYGYITNIELKEKTSSLLSDLPDGYTIWDKNGNKIEEDTNLLTGMTVRNKEGEKVGTVVIYGDVNGDNAIDGEDSLYIQLEMDKGGRLYGEARVAADINHDGEINSDDSLLAMLINLNRIPEDLQNKAAMNPNDIICHTNEEWREKYLNIIKERINETQYTVEYDEKNSRYVLKGGTKETKAGEILDIINDDSIDIRKSDGKTVLDREDLLDKVYRLYYKSKEEEKRSEDINLNIVIKFF